LCEKIDGVTQDTRGKGTRGTRLKRDAGGFRESAVVAKVLGRGKQRVHRVHAGMGEIFCACQGRANNLNKRRGFRREI